MFPTQKQKDEDKIANENKSNLQEKDRHDKNEQLLNEISEWKDKHKEVVDRLKVLEREKQDKLGDQGY